MNLEVLGQAQTDPSSAEKEQVIFTAREAEFLTCLLQTFQGSGGEVALVGDRAHPSLNIIYRHGPSGAGQLLTTLESLAAVLAESTWDVAEVEEQVLHFLVKLRSLPVSTLNHRARFSCTEQMESLFRYGE